MKKSLLDPERLVFAGLTCLVASILLAIILVFRASYVPNTTRVVVPSVLPAPIIATPDATRPLAVTPPSLTKNLVFAIDITLGSAPTPKQGNAFCVQEPSGRRYLISHASLMTQGEWQQVIRIGLKDHGEQQIGLVDVKPLYLGPFTEDHQPNLLSNPDLGEDLVIWSMPNAIPDTGLPLAARAPVPGEDAWIVDRPRKNTNAQSHFRCRVLEHTAHALSVQPLDRCSLDQIIGLPVVNQRGQIIGNVLGGNDLTLIGASHQGLQNRLKLLRSQ